MSSRPSATTRARPRNFISNSMDLYPPPLVPPNKCKADVVSVAMRYYTQNALSPSLGWRPWSAQFPSHTRKNQCVDRPLELLQLAFDRSRDPARDPYSGRRELALPAVQPEQLRSYRLHAVDGMRCATAMEFARTLGSG